MRGGGDHFEPDGHEKGGLRTGVEGCPDVWGNFRLLMHDVGYRVVILGKMKTRLLAFFSSNVAVIFDDLTVAVPERRNFLSNDVR